MDGSYNDGDRFKRAGSDGVCGGLDFAMDLATALYEILAERAA